MQKYWTDKKLLEEIATAFEGLAEYIDNKQYADGFRGHGMRDKDLADLWMQVSSIAAVASTENKCARRIRAAVQKTHPYLEDIA